MSRTGQTLVDMPEATVRVLVGPPGPRPHLHALAHRGRPGTPPPPRARRRLHRARGRVRVRARRRARAARRRHRARHPARGDPPLRARDHRAGRSSSTSTRRRCGFADYLFGETPPEEADNFFDPPRRTAARRARRPRSRSPRRARWSPTGPSGRSASSPTCPSCARPGRATSRARRAPARTSTGSTSTPSTSSPGSSTSGSGPEVERVHAGPGTFVARAARGRPHVPQRRARRRHLAQFPRTFQGFRELPPRSGLRLG